MQYTLKELRARSGYTQQRLARDIGVSAATVVSWERNPGSIKACNLKRLADAFGVGIEQISIFLPSNTENRTANHDE